MKTQEIVDNLLELLDAVDPVRLDWIEAVSQAIDIVCAAGGGYNK